MKFSNPVSVLFFVLCTLAACRNPTGNGAEERFSIQLLCQATHQDKLLPQSSVYAIVNHHKVKLASINSCDSIPAASYEDYDIPAEALAAVGGQWAGASDYLYAVREDSLLAFYQGWVEEGQEDDTYHYRRIGEFKNGRFNLELPAKKEDLVGTYALSREDGSHILFVGLREDTLVAEYFRMDGILPPVNQLNLLMTSMEPQEAGSLDISLSSLNFTSSLGRGKFVQDPKGAAVLLLDKQVQGQPLRMEKILSEDYSIPVE